MAAAISRSISADAVAVYHDSTNSMAEPAPQFAVFAPAQEAACL
ncbi:hypothetical protein [Parvibacter caecicola]|uniref:Uncharacterized protein n=1 Tax=Parvibacter caecicola TaxID=747645 RepID=A0A7W5D1G0_9ACTN|nr:hypothetical protein [Parvibacter caecicola]MBB3171114.1 hypothetical protein [Parvibacter caecicola]MCR2042092.1 hypothetical protein [Parvibacter caecicola]